MSRKGRRFPSPSPLLKSELGKTSAIESPQNGEVRAPYSAAFLDPQVQATRTGARSCSPLLPFWPAPLALRARPQRFVEHQHCSTRAGASYDFRTNRIQGQSRLCGALLLAIRIPSRGCSRYRSEKLHDAERSATDPLRPVAYRKFTTGSLPSASREHELEGRTSRVQEAVAGVGDRRRAFRPDHPR